MNDDSAKLASADTITHLIAWLSLCLLAAAWGSSLDAAWRPIWQQMGAFGLASAVGLQAAHRYRGARKLQHQRDALAKTVQRRLVTTLGNGNRSEEPNGEVLRLCHEIVLRETNQDGNDPRIAANRKHRAKVTRLDDYRSAVSQFSARFITAYIQDISTSGIGLAHEVPLPLGCVVLRSDCADGSVVEVFVEIRWCKPAAEGWYASGGRFVQPIECRDTTAADQICAVTP